MIQRFIELLSMKISRDFSQSAIVRLHHSYYVVAGGKRIRGSLSKWIKQMIKTDNKKRTETNFFLQILQVKKSKISGFCGTENYEYFSV
jgi:geranylgeranyl pyrophosphate synthase